MTEFPSFLYGQKYVDSQIIILIVITIKAYTLQILNFSQDLYYLVHITHLEVWKEKRFHFIFLSSLSELWIVFLYFGIPCSLSSSQVDVFVLGSSRSLLSVVDQHSWLAEYALM